MIASHLLISLFPVIRCKPLSPVPSQAFEHVNAGGDPGIIFVCDHASNALPKNYGTLGMTPAQLQTHIAFDIGAASVTRAMATALNAPAILGTHSRLLIDLNRGPDDPTLVMKLSDGAIITGNATADRAEVNARIDAWYKPYHDAIGREITRAKARGVKPAIISIHSFTPEWKGTPRPWQIGVLWSQKDRRLSDELLDVLRRETDLTVGDNQPYSGELEGDCMAQHAIAHGLAHVLIEIRQDLIASVEGATAWSKRLVPLVQQALTNLHAREKARSHMNEATRTEIEAAVFRRLVTHLQNRTDTQNIDLMNLAGFCRNCLGNWYEEAAKEKGLQLTRDDAREKIYGMPYSEWKSRYQTEASEAQKKAFEIYHKNPHKNHR